VPIADDYGVPDFTDLVHSYPESIREIERSIRQIIQRYEPRLEAVRVSFLAQDEDIFSARFQIVARLATEDEKIPVFFESLMGSDGRVKIGG
jgi:type VI secretion system protein